MMFIVVYLYDTIRRSVTYNYAVRVCVRYVYGKVQSPLSALHHIISTFVLLSLVGRTTCTLFVDKMLVFQYYPPHPLGTVGAPILRNYGDNSIGNKLDINHDNGVAS